VAEVASLEELFSRDPLEMAAEDNNGGRNFERIVEKLRALREQFKASEATGTKAPKVPKSKLPATRLEDLGL
jgi:hypothetical protein